MAKHRRQYLYDIFVRQTMFSAYAMGLDHDEALACAQIVVKRFGEKKGLNLREVINIMTKFLDEQERESAFDNQTQV